MFLIFEQVIYI